MGERIISERLTWTRCPTCGAPAAVSWAATAWAHGEPVEEVPAELYCSRGCPLSLEEIRRSWDESERRSSRSGG